MRSKLSHSVFSSDNTHCTVLYLLSVPKQFPITSFLWSACSCCLSHISKYSAIQGKFSVNVGLQGFDAYNLHERGKRAHLRGYVGLHIAKERLNF